MNSESGILDEFNSSSLDTDHLVHILFVLNRIFMILLISYLIEGMNARFMLDNRSMREFCLCE